MAKECFGQGQYCDDRDDMDDVYDEYEDSDEQGFIEKKEQGFKKEVFVNRKKMGKFSEPPESKKRHKNDAKNRYWRKHRDDVAW